MNFKILNPFFTDESKKRVRFTLEYENGNKSTAELVVPTNREKGKNKYWDIIVEEFDIDKMLESLDMRIKEHKKRKEHLEEKREADQTVRELRALFNLKAKIFEDPIIKGLDVETKSALRRAPSIEILMFFLYDIYKSYLTQNNMSYTDFLDYLEDLEDDD